MNIHQDECIHCAASKLYPLETQVRLQVRQNIGSVHICALVYM